MSQELMELLEAEQEAIRKAEDAIHKLNGPQPVTEESKEEADKALAERIAAHERVMDCRRRHPDEAA